jgi:hypothetical protein
MIYFGFVVSMQIILSVKYKLGNQLISLIITIFHRYWITSQSSLQIYYKHSPLSLLSPNLCFCFSVLLCLSLSLFLSLSVSLSVSLSLSSFSLFLSFFISLFQPKEVVHQLASGQTFIFVELIENRRTVILLLDDLATKLAVFQMNSFNFYPAKRGNLSINFVDSSYDTVAALSLDLTWSKDRKSNGSKKFQKKFGWHFSFHFYSFCSQVFI